jgi:hypothetical protein
MFPARNWDTMLGSVHVSVDDVIFATDQDTGGTIESFRRRQLPTRYLNKEIGPWIRWLAPFSHNMIEAQVELVVS